MKKYKAITLVELIIALTMVSVLLLMAFNVIYKKTKSLTMSQSGTFYCWKDWSGKLHQRLVTQTGSKVSIKPAGDGFVDECKLDLPNEVSRDVKNIRVFIIGGGAAGPMYKLMGFKTANETNNDNITDEISNDLFGCFELGEKKCLMYDSRTGLNPLDSGSTIPLSNVNSDFINNHKVFGGKNCFVKLCTFGDVNNPKCDNVYKIDKNYTELNGFYYYKAPLGTNNYSYDSCIRSGSNPVGYFSYLAKNGSVLQLDSREIEEFKGDITFAAANQLKYKISQASGINSFEEIDKVKLDSMKPLIIQSNQIGAGGVIDGSTVHNGDGGKTIFKSNKDDDTTIYPPADGQKHLESGNDNYIKLKYEFSDSSVKKSIQQVNTPIKVASLENESIKNFGLNYQDTHLSQYLKLTVPKLPNYSKNTGNGEKNYYGDGKDNGFGFFGYNGGSNNCRFEYYPYQYIDIYKLDTEKTRLFDSHIASAGYKPADDNCSYPGNGMGGAIIISW